MKFVEINKTNEDSFLVHCDKEAHIESIANRLARDYKEIFEKETFIFKCVRSDECLPGYEGYTITVSDNVAKEDNPFVNFINVGTLCGGSISSEFRITRHQDWSDVFRFLEFYCELKDKYGL